MRFLTALGVPLLLLASGLAAAHGPGTEVVREQGPYRITFQTYEWVTEVEELRLGWGVVDKATGAPRRVENPQVNVSWVDAAAGVTRQEWVPLQQRADGFVFGDINSGRFGEKMGSMRIVLPLEGENATFEVQVCRFDEAGTGLFCPGKTEPVCGFDEDGRIVCPPPKKSSGPGLVGILVAAFAAVLVATGRRQG